MLCERRRTRSFHDQTWPGTPIPRFNHFRKLVILKNRSYLWWFQWSYLRFHIPYTMQVRAFISHAVIYVSYENSLSCHVTNLTINVHVTHNEIWCSSCFDLTLSDVQNNVRWQYFSQCILDTCLHNINYVRWYFISHIAF